MSKHPLAFRTRLPNRRIASILMLLAMVLASVTAGVSAQSLRDVNNPTSGPQPQAAAPDKITRTENAKPGVYYIDYGGDPEDPAKYKFDGAIRFYSWSTLNPSDNNYNWAELDNFLATRKAKGLGTGIMITTYDGSTSGDILSTPNFVIKQANAVLPATYKDCANPPTCTQGGSTEYPHYINRFRSTVNGDFDGVSGNPGKNWVPTGNVTITSSPVPTDTDKISVGYVAQLGGVDNATGDLYHTEERIPAMPSTISPAKTVYVTARVGINTTDLNPNDHLYIEVRDKNGVKLGGAAQVDITNLSHPNGTYKDYEFDISSFGTENPVRVAFKVVTDGANPTTFFVDNVELRVRHLIPNYWPNTDAERTYYNAYKKFIYALGARYKNNSDLQFVAIGAGVYGENQPAQSDKFPEAHFDHVVEKYGALTGPDWVQFVNQLSLDHATAFSAGDGSGSPARHIFTQYAPTYKSSGERTQITDYGQSVGVGMSGNFLPVDWTQAYRTNNDGFYDPIRRYWNSVPVAFEAYKQDLCNPLMVYWALYGGLDKHVDYLRADPTLFRDYAGGPASTNVDYFDWAGNYAGKTAQNAPTVWTVMREHRNPTLSNCRGGGLYYQSSSASGGTYPQLGNFNFFLQQVDSIAGGKTVPETNDKGADTTFVGSKYPDAGLGNCPTNNGYRTDLFGADYPCYKTPYNSKLPVLGGQDNTYYNYKSWTGAGKEAYTVRRTDQATGNPYMWFKIDDGYMFGSGSTLYTATFTVSYFNIGTDKFSIWYQGPTGPKMAGSIQKNGTNAYEKRSFTVSDAKFTNGLTGGADFYLDSRDPTSSANDGNEWLHMMSVERLDTGTEPGTETPTPTITPTPSATPSPTPTTGRVEGKAFNDVNGNNKLDAGEPGAAGAVIILEDYNTSQEAYSAIAGADGSYQFAAVSPGQYTLKEKTAPPGYTKSVYQITFIAQANVTMSLGTNFPHTQLATAVPTLTPTVTTTPGTPTGSNKTYLPLLTR